MQAGSATGRDCPTHSKTYKSPGSSFPSAEELGVVTTRTPDTGVPREGLPEAVHAPSSAKTGKTPRLGGKSILIPLGKKHEGIGVKLHIHLDILLLQEDLGVSPVLCSVPWFHHTDGAPCCFLGSSVPWSWAGESSPLKGGHCSRLAWLFLRGFPFPPCGHCSRLAWLLSLSPS